MLDYIKRYEYERLQQRLDELEKVQREHKDKLGMLKRKAEFHLNKHRQEKCEHKNKSYSRSIYPPTFPKGHTQTLLCETCTDCDKTLSELFVIPGEAKDIEWQKRKLNYEKEVHRKKLIAVREQIKALEEEKK